jgi:hypothetical protein
LLDWRIAAWRTDEDALNAHGCLGRWPVSTCIACCMWSLP